MVAMCLLPYARRSAMSNSTRSWVSLMPRASRFFWMWAIEASKMSSHSGMKCELAAVPLFPLVGVDVRHDVGCTVPGVDAAEDDVGAGADAVGGDLEGLLAVVLRRDADGRDLVDVVAQAAGLDDVGEDGQDAGVVDAGAHVEHRRHAGGLADLGEAGAGVLEHLGGQVAVLARGVGGAAGDHHEDVVLDEVLDQVDDALVLGDLGVVAADDGSDALDLAVDDVVVERHEALAERATQHVADVLVREAGDHRALDVGDVDVLGPAVRVVVDRHLDDLLGDLERVLLVELDVRRAGDLAPSCWWSPGGCGTCPPPAASPSNTHWMSTTMSSTAPVRMASSWWRLLPAGGTPRRIQISLAVQQMPPRVMPLAPLLLAYSIISGSWAASTISSESVGSWPWMMMLTSSSFRTPRLDSLVSGLGVPQMMSERSVASMEPPQPAARHMRMAWSMRWSASWSPPRVRAVHGVDHLAVEAARASHPACPTAPGASWERGRT